MTNKIHLLFLLLFCMATFSTCEDKQETPVSNYDAEKPTIENVSISPSSGITLTSKVNIKGRVLDDKALKSLTVSIVDITGSTVDSENIDFDVLESTKLTSYDFDTNLLLNYTPISTAGEYKIVVKVTDKQGNLAEYKSALNVSKPSFDKLYLMIEGNAQGLEMTKNAINPSIYEVVTHLFAGAKIRIASQSNGGGIIWGLKDGKLLEVGSTTPVDLQLTTDATDYKISFNIDEFMIILPKIKVSSYYIIGPANNPNWTILGAEIEGYSEGGITEWKATGVALNKGEFKFIKAPAGVIDLNSGVGYDNGSITVSSTSTPLYIKDAGTYDISLKMNDATNTINYISISNDIHSIIYSSNDGITVDDVKQNPITLTGTLLTSSVNVDYPYWFKPATIFTLNKGATLIVPSSISLSGATYDDRFFSISGNTISYVGQSGQRWSLNFNFPEKVIQLGNPDITMVAPDVLWMTGANFWETNVSGANVIAWNRWLPLKRISETKYECSIAIQNSTPDPALFRIIGQYNWGEAFGWVYNDYQPHLFASPLPEGLSECAADKGNFQLDDNNGNIFTLVVDLAGGEGKYSITLTKTGTLP